MIDDERLRELLARGYEETKGVSFATYVRDRKLDRDGEEAPMIRAMQLAVTEAIKGVYMKIPDAFYATHPTMNLRWHCGVLEQMFIASTGETSWQAVPMTGG